MPIIFTLFSFLFSFGVASAHEAYVLPYDTFWHGIKENISLHAFDALKDPHNLSLVFIIGFSVLFVLVLNFLFRRSGIGERVSDWLEQYAYLGEHFIRITIAVSFFCAALSHTFLAPEIHQSAFFYPDVVSISLFVVSIMIALGIFTELAALVGIFIFINSFLVFGPYVFTYVNYLGELIVLLLFGIRAFSIDKYIFGPLTRFQNLVKYKSVIVRVLYGVALIYAAVTVKLLHPELTLLVVNTWHLTKFSLLFPSDPLLVTLGAGVVEALIGLFIIFGFEMRLAVLVSLFYITLSLFFFQELVWPHLLLYGISFNLLVQPETFTLDHILLEKHRKTKKWWKRSFLL